MINEFKIITMEISNRHRIVPLLLVGFILIFSFGCDKDKADEPQTPNDTIDHNPNLLIPEGWSKVGNINANNMIWAITKDGSGHLFAGGYFTNSSGFSYVAKWDGTTWSTAGLNANGGIFALTTDADDNVYAVGNFSNGATPDGGNHYVAMRNNSGWSDIGPSHSDLLLTADAVGNVYNGLAKWDNNAWSNFGMLNPEMNGSVYALATHPSGNAQYAGGNFAHSNGYRYIAKWDGTAWSELGSLNANDDINALVVDNNGHVYAAGDFTNGNLSSNGYRYVAFWDGNAWSELGSLNANGSIYSLALDNNTGFVYASGYFTNSEGKYCVVQWDGTSWNDLGDMALAPTPIYVDASGKLYSVIASHDGQIYCVVVHE